MSSNLGSTRQLYNSKYGDSAECRVPSGTSTWYHCREVPELRLGLIEKLEDKLKTLSRYRLSKDDTVRNTTVCDGTVDNAYAHRLAHLFPLFIATYPPFHFVSFCALVR